MSMRTKSLRQNRRSNFSTRGQSYRSGSSPQGKRKSRRKSRRHRTGSSRLSRNRTSSIERLEDRFVLAATSFLTELADLQADSLLPASAAPLTNISEIVTSGNSFTNSYSGTPFNTGAMFRTIGASRATEAISNSGSALGILEPGTTNEFVFVFALEATVSDNTGRSDYDTGMVWLFTTPSGTFNSSDPTTWGAVDGTTGEFNTPFAAWELKDPEIVNEGQGESRNFPADQVNTFAPDAISGLSEPNSRLLFREAEVSGTIDPNNFISISSVSNPDFYTDEGLFTTGKQTLSTDTDPLDGLGDTAGAQSALNAIGEQIFATTVTGAADSNFFADFTVTTDVGFTPEFDAMSMANTSGDFKASIDFRLDPGAQFEAPEIRGQKFEDLNANGIKDAGEPGLEGWTINLQGTSLDGQAVSLTTVTDVDGNYVFQDDPSTTDIIEFFPGTYTIYETLQTNWSQSFPASAGQSLNLDGETGEETQTVSVTETGAGDIGYEIILGSGRIVENADFGNYLPGSVHGFKYLDLNDDGEFNSNDELLSGIQFRLTGTDGMGQSVDILSDETDENGEFWITGVNPTDGSYTLTEVVADGETPVQVTGLEIISGREYVANEAQRLALIEDGIEADRIVILEDLFIANAPTLGSIHGFKFEDLNGNGLREEGEPGLQNWIIFLDGSYDGELNGELDWEDAGEMNGIWDEGEGERWIATDENGEYWFEDLDLDNYLVFEEQQEGWVQSAPATVIASVTIGNGQEYVATQEQKDALISEGIDEDFIVINSDLAFGNYQQGTITGHKYQDVNGDGTDLQPLEGWTIFLDEDNDGMLDAEEVSTTTAADGSYSFTDLDPGVYVVTEVLQTGWTQTSPAATGLTLNLDGVTGDETTTVSNSLTTAYSVELLSGRTAADADFWNTPATGSIHGYKWHDKDFDGVWDEHEPGLNNWIIYLDDDLDGELDWEDQDSDGEWDSGEGEQWVRTMDDTNHETNGESTLAAQSTSTSYDEDHVQRGAYWFENVAAGEHTIREVIPPNWLQSYPNSDAQSHVVTVVGNQTIQGTYGVAEVPNFGNYENKPGSIHGHVFHDVDMDGIWDDDEHGLPGITVYIDLDQDSQRDFADEPIYVTMDGHYSSDSSSSESTVYSRTMPYSQTSYLYGQTSNLWDYSWSHGGGTWASKTKYHGHESTYGAYWAEGLEGGQTYYLRVDAPGYTLSDRTEALISAGIILEPGQKYVAPYGATAIGNIGIYMAEDSVDEVEVAVASLTQGTTPQVAKSTAEQAIDKALDVTPVVEEVVEEPIVTTSSSVSQLAEVAALVESPPSETEKQEALPAEEESVESSYQTSEETEFALAFEDEDVAAVDEFFDESEEEESTTSPLYLGRFRSWV